MSEFQSFGEAAKNKKYEFPVDEYAKKEDLGQPSQAQPQNAQPQQPQPQQSQSQKRQPLRPVRSDDKVCPIWSDPYCDVPCNAQCKLWRHAPKNAGFECPFQELASISFAFRKFDRPEKNY